ncbi:hypothetical protein CK203_043982 [Vitis vinifera]|uniref:Retrovirus-related Pol polyprotein from transposon TNT 1-94 n=1 Tax=Vitis vinifera TaxID=29760 RepID=A0A438HTH0_VITVI|nr:hypothetical protein CK203_043982 [Vitis vinifera]
MVGGNLVTWRSKKQPVVARSNAKEEYMVVTQGKCELQWLKRLLEELRVKFEGSNGGTWVSVTERSRGFVVSVGFGREEVVWLTEHLKKAVELENTRGFTRKFRGENKIHLMEICFNNRGRFMKSPRLPQEGILYFLSSRG